MSKRRPLLHRTAFWAVLFGMSMVMWVLIGVVVNRLRWTARSQQTDLPIARRYYAGTPEPSLSAPRSMVEQKRISPAIDAALLTAAGTLTTSVASLIGMFLTHRKSKCERELERQARKDQLALERARLELERLRIEGQQRDNDDLLILDVATQGQRG